MNVQELIDALLLVKDKTLPVVYCDELTKVKVVFFEDYQDKYGHIQSGEVCELDTNG